MAKVKSKAFAGIGTQLQTDFGLGGSYTTIAEILTITGPGGTVADAQVTNMGSPGGVAEFIPTILNSGEVSFEVNYVPTDSTQKSATAMFAAKTVGNFQIVFADTANTVFGPFTGFINKFEPESPHDKEVKAKLGIKISGPVTYPT